MDNEYRTPIEVGADLRRTHFADICDNQGEHISDRNLWYRELTGIYYLWKNVHNIKFIGLEHYGRRWNFNPKDVLDGLSDGSIPIIVHPMKFKNTLREIYVNNHSEKDIQDIEDIIKEEYPEYIESFDKYVNHGHILLSNNNFIVAKEEFDKLCEFIFGVIDIFLDKNNIGSYEDARKHAEEYAIHIATPGKDWIDYQAGIPGFLAERLCTLYILHNFPKIKIGEYKDIEHEEY